jgi:hypothetical protein
MEVSRKRSFFPKQAYKYILDSNSKCNFLKRVEVAEIAVSSQSP